MSRQRQSGEADPPGPVGPGELLSFGTLFLGVLGVLALAAYLRTESVPEHPSTSSEVIVDSSMAGPDRRLRSDSPVANPAEDRESAVSARERAPAATAAPSTLVRTSQVNADLVRRAEGDLQRLAAAGHPWTLQLALLCDPEGAREALDRFGSHGAFYLLPVLHDDRACFVLCWNRYENRDAAKAARDLPGAIRSRYPGAFPKTIAEVLR